MTDVQPTDLLGRWILQRRLTDRRAGVIGRVTGTLELSRVGDDQVRWFEQGELAWDGRTLEVHRELFVRREPDQWMVYFNDGRPFHPWLPGKTVEHPCVADLYRGYLDVDRDRARLRVLWDVAGPAKDQRIISRCRRATDSGA